VREEQSHGTLGLRFEINLKVHLHLRMAQPACYVML